MLRVICPPDIKNGFVPTRMLSPKTFGQRQTVIQNASARAAASSSASGMPSRLRQFFQHREDIGVGNVETARAGHGALHEQLDRRILPRRP
jgi:hypothetical protein